LRFLEDGGLMIQSRILVNRTKEMATFCLVTKREIPMAKLEFLQRYPLKGFPGQRLEKAELDVGKGLDWDRHFAILSGAATEEPIAGGFIKAVNFIQNTYTDDLQKFSTDIDFDQELIGLTSFDGTKVEFDLTDPESWQKSSEVLRGWFTAGDKNPRLVRQAPAKGHWDFTDSNLSLLNLASHRMLESHYYHSMDPVRHRSNLHVEFDKPWVEFELLGKRFKLGEAEFEAFRPAKRCATISVDPKTGERDLNLAGLMQADFGHAFLGIYCRVVKSGSIKAGDSLEILGEALGEYPVPFNAPRPELWPRLANLDSGSLTFEQNEHPEIAQAEQGTLRLHTIGKEVSWYKCRIERHSNSHEIELGPESAEIENGRYLVTGPF